MCLGSDVSLGALRGGDNIERLLPRSLARTPVGDLKEPLASGATFLSFCAAPSASCALDSLCFCDELHILGSCEGGRAGLGLMAEVVGLVMFLMLGGEWEASLIGSSFSSSPKPPSTPAL